MVNEFVRKRVAKCANTNEPNAPEQRVSALAVVPDLLRELGEDPAEVIASAGLPAGVLDDDENRIPYAAVGRLLRGCVARTGCPHFGLLAGQRAGLAYMGLVGKLMRHSPTVGAALRTLVVYHGLNSQGGLIFLSEQTGVAALGYAIYQKDVQAVEQICDGVIAMALSGMRELCGPNWAPERVLFSRAKPGDVLPYRRFFRAPCRFDSEHTALLFPTHWLERPLADSDPELLRTLEEQAHARAGINLIARLQRALRTLLISGGTSGDEVASSLEMHRRTFNRRLRALGTTFQAILDQVRFAISCQLLDSSDIALTEIAASLGYAEASAFSRAFRRWSGKTPFQRRRAARPALSRSRASHVDGERARLGSEGRTKVADTCHGVCDQREDVRSRSRSAARR